MTVSLRTDKLPFSKKLRPIFFPLKIPLYLGVREEVGSWCTPAPPPPTPKKRKFIRDIKSFCCWQNPHKNDRGKRTRSDLENHGANPDANEDRGPLQSLDVVALFMNLASIDFIEEGHHDKGVEDDGEVLVGESVQFLGIFYPIINAKQFRTCTEAPTHDSGFFNQNQQPIWGSLLSTCLPYAAHPSVLCSIMKTLQIPSRKPYKQVGRKQSLRIR